MTRLNVPLSVTDAVAILGLVLLTIGAGLIALPAAFLVCGGFLLLYAIFASRQETTP